MIRSLKLVLFVIEVIGIIGIGNFLLKDSKSIKGKPIVDYRSAVDIADQVAVLTKLPEATAVNNQTDSFNTPINKQELVAMKPQVMYVPPVPKEVEHIVKEQPIKAVSLIKPFIRHNLFNGYDYGYCTWYVASRIDIPKDWGNASTWDNRALLDGWTVSDRPVIGAIAQTDRAAQGLGHVAVVEDVDYKRGMIKYADMNGIAGWNKEGFSGWVKAIGIFDRFIYK